MKMYHITFAASAVKELSSLPKNVQARIEKTVDSLMENPRPFGAIKLKGEKGVYRIRVGDYRVIYSIDDNNYKIDVSVVRNRKDAYR